MLEATIHRIAQDDAHFYQRDEYIGRRAKITRINNFNRKGPYVACDVTFLDNGEKRKFYKVVLKNKKEIKEDA